jgi:broad specificity phosphatase PhoE
VSRGIRPAAYGGGNAGYFIDLRLSIGISACAAIHLRPCREGYSRIRPCREGNLASSARERPESLAAGLSPAMLLLVRHAMPAVDPAADPSAWPLSSQGLAASRLLARVLPASALLVASDEPKAWQTLDPDGSRPVKRDSRLAEVRRREAFSDDFREARRSYVSGSQIAGWEPRAEVARRFGDAVRDAAAQGAGRDVVIASHGMAMTVWLSRAVLLADPGEFWEEMQRRFPDLLAVDLRARTVQRLKSR